MIVKQQKLGPFALVWIAHYVSHFGPLKNLHHMRISCGSPPSVTIISRAGLLRARLNLPEANVCRNDVAKIAHFDLICASRFATTEVENGPDPTGLHEEARQCRPADTQFSGNRQIVELDNAEQNAIPKQ